MAHDYRDRIYIRKDIIMKLAEHGELNQTKLLSFCGLNIVKHKGILNDMVDKKLIFREKKPWGSKSLILYKATPEGQNFCDRILDAYEEMFPRKEKENNVI